MEIWSLVVFSSEHETCQMERKQNGIIDKNNNVEKYVLDLL